MTNENEQIEVGIYLVLADKERDKSYGYHAKVLSGNHMLSEEDIFCRGGYDYLGQELANRLMQNGIIECIIRPAHEQGVVQINDFALEAVAKKLEEQGLKVTTKPEIVEI